MKLLLTFFVICAVLAVSMAYPNPEADPHRHFGGFEGGRGGYGGGYGGYGGGYGGYGGGYGGYGGGFGGGYEGGWGR